MMTLCLFLLLAVLGDMARRRIPLLSAPFILTVYLAVAIAYLQAVLAWELQGSRLLSFPRDTIQAGAPYAAGLYLFVGGLAWAASFGSIPVRPLNANAPTTISTPPAITISALFAVSILAVAHLLSINLSYAWFHSNYEIFNSPQAMGIDNAAISIFHFTMPMAMVCLGAVAFISVANGNRPIAAWSFILFAYMWLYQLGSHSRWAGVSLISSGIVYALIARRGAVTTLASTSTIGAAAYIHAIVGRNSGEHGLSTIFSTWKFFKPELTPDYLFVVMFTLVEGVFSNCMGIVKTAIHSPAYKILSFSPLPSFIDGFDKIRFASEIRISYHRPMGAWAEAIHFGPVFFILFSAVAFALLWVNSSLVKVTKTPITSIMSVLTALFLVFANAYPMRNTFRVLLVILAVQMWLLYREWSRSRKATSRGTRQSLPQSAGRSSGSVA